MFKLNLLAILVAVLLTGNTGMAQTNVAVGQWRLHFPFNNPLGLTMGNGYIYSWARMGFFRTHLASGEIDVLSKITGFTDFEVSEIKHSKDFGVLLIAYQNAKFDLLYDNGILTANTDIFRSNITGLKTINHINIDGDYAFFSCGFGIYVYDLRKNESPATYLDTSFTIVNASAKHNNTLYAATPKGIYRGGISGIITVPVGSWTMQKTGDARFLEKFNNRFYAVVDSTLLSYDVNFGDEKIITSGKIGFTAMENNAGRLVVTSDSGLFEFDANHQMKFTSEKGIVAAFYDSEGKLWYCSKGVGLISRSPGGHLDYHYPRGPYSLFSGEMAGINGKMWITGGEIMPKGGATYSINGYYRFNGGFWFNSIPSGVTGLDTVRDIHAITKDAFTDDVWMAGFYQGLFRIRNDQLISFYNQDNSMITLEPTTGITSLVFDKNNNLWIANFKSPEPLVVRTPDDAWNSFSLGPNNKVMQIIVDDNNRKWVRYFEDQGSNAGLAVYDDNNTPLDADDDIGPKFLSTVKGNGELPDNQVQCMAVDHDGEIWVGTAKGLSVFYSPSNILSNNASDSRQIIIGEGEDLGYLMGEESITAIYVDGGNRKWIASQSGLWLVSPDGSKILEHFSVDNSPLISNGIRQLAMIEESGELFISTDKGIISYRTDATAGGDKHENVKVFPNPVRPQYEGKITIQGLPEKAQVKITDIAGNLIYETRSNGGTAAWDGRNFDGRRASTGVYLVFSSNEDASDTYVSKILFIGR